MLITLGLATKNKFKPHFFKGIKTTILPKADQGNNALKKIIYTANLHSLHNNKSNWNIDHVKNLSIIHNDKLTNLSEFSLNQLNQLSAILQQIINKLKAIRKEPRYIYADKNSIFWHLTNSAHTILKYGFKKTFNRYGFNVYLASGLKQIYSIINDPLSYINRSVKGFNHSYSVLKVKVTVPVYHFNKLEALAGQQIKQIANTLKQYPVRLTPEKSYLSDIKHRDRLVWNYVLEEAGIQAVASPYRANGHEIMLTDPTVATCLGISQIVNAPN